MVYIGIYVCKNNIDFLIFYVYYISKLKGMNVDHYEKSWEFWGKYMGVNFPILYFVKVQNFT